MTKKLGYIWEHPELGSIVTGAVPTPQQSQWGGSYTPEYKVVIVEEIPEESI